MDSETILKLAIKENPKLLEKLVAELIETRNSDVPTSTPTSEVDHEEIFTETSESTSSSANLKDKEKLTADELLSRRSKGTRSTDAQQSFRVSFEFGLSYINLS